MMPQQTPYSPALASGAPPLYGQPGFFPSNSSPQPQGLVVHVGVPVFGTAVPQAFAHVGNEGVGNVPFSTINQQTHFVQGQQNNLVQGVRPSNGFSAPPNANLPGHWQEQPGLPGSPPPSSFPPGFEPGHNNNYTMGRPVVHNPHQVHHQHQHRHVSEHDYRHQQQNQHQRQHQPQPQHDYAHKQHQVHQQHHPHQPQPQHQHQRQHQPQPQHDYLHKQHQVQQQSHPHQLQPQHQHHNQHANQHHHQHQHDHQYQHQHQHQLQQQIHHQHQQNYYQHQQIQHQHAHSQVKTQAQHYQNPHPHSLPELQLQAQPHPVQLQTGPQSQPQLQNQPQLAQLQTWPQQVQPACQQVQLLPASFTNSLNAYPPNIQAGSENGVAIGLPVMPTPSHVENIASQTGLLNQQPAQAWQPSYPENSFSLQPAPQSSNSSFTATNNDQDNHPEVVIPKKDHHSNSWQLTNIQRNDHSNVERQTDPSQGHAHRMAPIKSDSWLCADGTKSSDVQRINQTQSNGHLGSGTSHPSSLAENSQQRWLSPCKLQTPAWASGRKPPHVSRGLQPPFNGQGKFHANGKFSIAEKCNNGQRISQLQRHCESSGKNFNKDVQNRSDMQPRRCDPCDRTFTSSDDMAAHLKAHVKCGEEGCTFEAAAKLVKEHRVIEHGKVDIKATYRGRKALALRSMEDKEDVRQWREERKRSYPTTANILRKAEEQKRMEAEGEFVDKEAEMRCQRMRDVIAKQKQLGFQVPEIPSHYLHKRHDRRPKKMFREETAIRDAAEEKTGNLVGTKRTADDMETTHDGATNTKDDSLNMEPMNDGCQRKGYARKGYQSKINPRHERHKRHQKYDARMAQPRPPTLLLKLLHDDIQKESSYLLQCCRFIVNNSFLQDCSPTSLKHFEWIAAAMPASLDGSSVDLIDSKAQVKLEIGEDVAMVLNSEISASGEEIIPLLDSKESVAEVENKATDAEERGMVIVAEPSLMNTQDIVACRDTEDAPYISPTSLPNNGRKNQEQSLICKEPGKNDSTMQNVSCSTPFKSNNSQLNHPATNKVAGSVHTSVSSCKPASKSDHLSYDDVEAGEVISGHTESIVEDEEEISQYMNFDANGADSGCCYD